MNWKTITWAARNESYCIVNYTICTLDWLQLIITIIFYRYIMLCCNTNNFYSLLALRLCTCIYTLFKYIYIFNIKAKYYSLIYRINTLSQDRLSLKTWNVAQKSLKWYRCVRRNLLEIWHQKKGFHVNLVIKIQNIIFFFCGLL